MRRGSFRMQGESEKGMTVNQTRRNLAGLALFAGAVICAVSAISQSAPQSAPQPAPQAAPQPAAQPDTARSGRGPVEGPG